MRRGTFIANIGAHATYRRERYFLEGIARSGVACTHEPDITEKYFFKSRVLSDWRVGSPIEFRRVLLGFIPFTLRGTVTQVEPEHRLQYKLMHHKFFGAPGPDEFSLVTDTIEAEKGGSRLTITDDVGTSPGFERRYARSVKGWKTILSGLKKTLEQG